MNITKLFGQANEKSFRSADVAEAIRVLVLNHITNELCSSLAEPVEHLVNDFHGEHYSCS